MITEQDLIDLGFKKIEESGFYPFYDPDIHDMVPISEKIEEINYWYEINFNSELYLTTGETKLDLEGDDDWSVIIGGVDYFLITNKDDVKNLISVFKTVAENNK